MAAAKPDMFDDVVVTNNPKLMKTIFLWSHALRISAQREKKYPGSISNQLKKYQDVLKTMKFTFPNNDTLVDTIIKDLVKQFEENWNEETQRQKDMAKRVSEILLRWHGAVHRCNVITERSSGNSGTNASCSDFKSVTQDRCKIELDRE